MTVHELNMTLQGLLLLLEGQKQVIKSKVTLGGQKDAMVKLEEIQSLYVKFSNEDATPVKNTYAVFFKAGGWHCDCSGKEAPFYLLKGFKVYPTDTDGSIKHVDGKPEQTLSLADFQN